MKTKNIFKHLFCASMLVIPLAYPANEASIDTQKEIAQKAFDSLQAINKSLENIKNDNTAAWEKAHSDYLNVQKTKFNVLFIDQEPKTVNKLANEIMDRINKYFVHSSINKASLNEIVQTTLDGQIFVNEGNKLLQQAQNKATENKNELDKKRPGFVGASQTGTKANELFKKAALEFIKAAKAFKYSKNFKSAFDAYQLAIKAMESIKHAPVSPYVLYIDYLIIFDTKIHANKMIDKAKIVDFKPYNLETDADNLIRMSTGQTAQTYIQKSWGETNKLFFNQKTLEEEQKAINKIANPKSKK